MYFFRILFISIICFANNFVFPNNIKNAEKPDTIGLTELVDSFQHKYSKQKPKRWSDQIKGSCKKIKTEEKIIALTFDACGGLKAGDGYDEELINYLIDEKIPASLFINYRWIDENPVFFEFLALTHQFDIENHGYKHKPLSVNGKKAMKINGTKDIKEVVEEIYFNSKKIEKLTGKKPLFFRSGTAYCDDISLKILNEMGYKLASFDVLGDCGAKYSKRQVKRALLNAEPGSIVILHMNHPEGYTYEGIKEAIPILKKKGFKFVKLSDYVNMMDN